MKIRKSYLSIALMALTVQTGMAQEQKRDSLDTGKVYEIGEVVVTGTRNETDVRHLSQTVSVVNRSKIDQALQPSLLPVLTEQIPGLFVTSRGVMGKNYLNYDFTIILSHFKGHAMGGFGGAIKNMSIGIASSNGKRLIHSAGTSTTSWGNPAQDDFLESMAEAAKAVADHCGGNILYISVANNLSVDCDCDSSPADPEMGDIGILASLDPVALDRACTDLVRSSEDHGKIHLIERIDSRHGMHTLDHAESLGMGSQKYELVELD